jgi:hypothetical protein
MPKKKRKDTRVRVWPDKHRKTKTVRPQDHADPQPRAPAGTTQRGGKQTAEELRNPPMRPNPRGGLLRSGGTNKGGKGATPRVLRERCRETLATNRVFNVPLKVIKNPRASEKDKLKAWALLAQFGGLASLSITDNDGNPIELPAFVVQAISAERKVDEAATTTVPQFSRAPLREEPNPDGGDTW